MNTNLIHSSLTATDNNDGTWTVTNTQTGSVVIRGTADEAQSFCAKLGVVASIASSPVVAANSL